MNYHPPRTKLEVSVNCPCCGQSLKSVSNFTDGITQPAKDDVTICWECGAVCVFGDNNTLRLMEPTDVMTWPSSTRDDLAKALATYRQAKMGDMSGDSGRAVH